MQVFISWSGPSTNVLGLALKRFLEDTFAGHVSAFVSSVNVAPGKRFEAVIAEGLQSSALGILLVTPANQQSPWLLFEAGSLAYKDVDGSVIPIVIGMKRTDLLSPLNLFQNARAAERDDFELVCERIRKMTQMPEGAFRTLFDANWPDLEHAFSVAATASKEELKGQPAVAARPIDDMVREILVTVNDLSRHGGAAGVYEAPRRLPVPAAQRRIRATLPDVEVRRVLEPTGNPTFVAEASETPSVERMRRLREIARESGVPIRLVLPDLTVWITRSGAITHLPKLPPQTDEDASPADSEVLESAVDVP